MEKTNLKISSSPHVRSKDTTSDIMFDVIIALVPATAFGVYQFGLHSLVLVVACIVSALLAELLYEKGMKRPVTVKDFSAVVTGLLLALNLPPNLPVWMAILGSVFAIIVVKQLFGGLGQNFMNPALGARCFLLLSFSRYMTEFVYDGVATATPLAVIKNGAGLEGVSIRDMFFGYTAGTIGETSAAALLIGAIYLLARKVISPRIPLIYIGTFAIAVFVYSLATGSAPALAGEFTLAQLCGGGLMLGAWFMATDYVTSPITPAGKVVYGITLGLLTFVLRTFGGSAEGVSYAIIISNILVPLIEKATVPRCFGYGADISKEQKKAQKAEEKKAKKEEKKSAGEAGEEDAPKARIDGKGIVKAIFAIFAITLIMGAALGVVYDVTKEPIKNADEKAKQEAYREVYPDAKNIIAAKDIDYDKFNEAVAALGYPSDTLDEINYVADDDGRLQGLIMVVTNHDGYGGDITMAVGITEEGIINGISFLSINETAGLGMEAKNKSFTDQFVGKDVSSFKYTKSGSTRDDEIDALSGATITTSAVTDAVNAVLNVAALLLGGM